MYCMHAPGMDVALQTQAQPHEQNQEDGSHDLLIGQLKVLRKPGPRFVILSIACFVIIREARQSQSATIKSVNSYTNLPVLTLSYTEQSVTQLNVHLIECHFN